MSSQLTPAQYTELLRGITPARVKYHPHSGFAHLEQWDVRRTLTRIFGFAGWGDETLELTLLRESSRQLLTKKGEPVTDQYNEPVLRWTVAYRAQVRLIVKDRHGTVIDTFDDAAVGEAVNQVTYGDAHDLAVKTALSQALKRCAVNLGDQFGLSLYDDGSFDAVVRGTCTPPDVDGGDTQPLPEVGPVGRDPQDVAAEQVAVQAGDADGGTVIGGQLSDGVPVDAALRVLPEHAAAATTARNWLLAARRSEAEIDELKAGIVAKGLEQALAVKVLDGQERELTLADLFGQLSAAAAAGAAAQAATHTGGDGQRTVLPKTLPCGCDADAVIRTGVHVDGCIRRHPRATSGRGQR